MKLVFTIYFHIPCLLRSRQAPTLRGVQPSYGKYWLGRPLRERARLLPKRTGVAGHLRICTIWYTHKWFYRLFKFTGRKNFHDRKNVSTFVWYIQFLHFLLLKMI